MPEPVTVQQIIAAGWPAAESHDAAERPERARAILALFAPYLKADEELGQVTDELVKLREENAELSQALQDYRLSHEAAIVENAALRARVMELEALDDATRRAYNANLAELRGLRVQLAAAERVVADLAKHECPLGPRVVWCPRHDVYHPTAFDKVLGRLAITKETRDA